MSKSREIDELSRDELIDLCKNQREHLNFLNRFMQEHNNNSRVHICILESLSLMEDIEQLKNENMELRKKYERDTKRDKRKGKKTSQ